MEAKELRIGNWVNHLDNWSYRQPKTDFKEFYFKWDESDFYALGECTLNLEDVQPIPLTEEILLKCGFEYNNNYGQFKHPNCPLYFTKHPNNKTLLCFIHNCTNGTTKFLHQLQNLYFALTNTELTVNL